MSNLPLMDEDLPRWAAMLAAFRPCFSPCEACLIHPVTKIFGKD
jgi:hypothetical protein